MSHVISAQPSATSPYQPTALQEGKGGDNPPRIHRIDSEQHDDCCIHTRNRKGCCLFVCRLLSMCCQGIRNCTERCCECCADSLNDCCEDKPRERNQRIYNKRYKNSGGIYYDNTTDNNDDWGIPSLSEQYTNVGVGSGHREPLNSNDDCNSLTHHKSCHDSATLPLGGQHNSSKHHSSVHDSGTHHSSSHHDSGTHHSSSHHDSSTHHTSSHDTSTCHDLGGGDTGGGCDSGGGDTGGGCDSGGGDSGGGCDSGGGND